MLLAHTGQHHTSLYTGTLKGRFHCCCLCVLLELEHQCELGYIRVSSAGKNLRVYVRTRCYLGPTAGERNLLQPGRGSPPVPLGRKRQTIKSPRLIMER